MSNYKKEKPKPHGLACCANCKYYDYEQEYFEETYCCKLNKKSRWPEPWHVCEDWEMEPY